MAFITKFEALAAFRESQSRQTLRKSARDVLRESADSFYDGKKYAVFLSHCHEDAEVIAGVKYMLEKTGVSVYVDRIDEPQLNPDNVTPATADKLRVRMRACASMLFATSKASPNSKWMPWELGYFDGLRQGQIAVLPLVETPSDGFKGQEYIGLYPVFERLPTTTGGQAHVIRTAEKYMFIEDFAAGRQSYHEFR
jgi:hypothetical protein